MIEITAALNDLRLSAVASFLALGTAPATVAIYGGPRPTLGGMPTGDLLVTLELVEPIGTVAAGVLTLEPTPEAMISTSGTATWARVVNGDGALAWDCDVSDLTGSGELRLSTVQLYQGGYTRLVSGTLG